MTEEPKIKKPYASVNALTGVVVKRFKTPEKLAKYLCTPKDVGLGKIRPIDLFNVPALITKETDEEILVSRIEFVNEGEE